MPRGDNPNSRKNLSKGTPFSTETARKAQKKSAESHKYAGYAKKSLKEGLTDEELRKFDEVLKKRALSGNLAALKMIYELTDERQEQTVSNEITINLKKDDYDDWSN